MKHHTFKKISSTLAAMLFLPLAVSAQWVPAPANPPSNNAAAPINVSSSNQAKAGGLQVGSFLSDGGAVILGNLGVGAVPSYKFDVVGDANATRLCIATDCRSVWPSGGGSSITINTGGGLTGGTTNTTFSLSIDNTLIQTRVSGTCSGSQFMQSINQNGTVGCATASGGGGTVTSVGGGSNITISGSATAPVVNVVSSPTFAGSVTAPAYYYSSDKNLKYNIADLGSELSLQNILKLQGVSFDWKATGKHSTGLIAQDVEKVYPDLVATDPSTGLKSVEYGNLVAPLIEAVKAQQREIDALKAEVAALKK